MSLYVGFVTKANPDVCRGAVVETDDYEEARKSVTDSFSCVRVLAVIPGGKKAPNPTPKKVA